MRHCMKINKKYLALSALTVLVVAGGVFLYTDKASAPTHSAAPAAQQAVPQIAHVLLSIDGLYNAKQVAITGNETALGVLQEASAGDSQVRLSTKVYAGLGTLVDGLNGIKNGTGKKYWQYKVNGMMPQIGAGQYKLKDGDSIDWFFGSSQQ